LESARENNFLHARKRTFTYKHQAQILMVHFNNLLHARERTFTYKVTLPDNVLCKTPKSFTPYFFPSLQQMEFDIIWANLLCFPRPPIYLSENIWTHRTAAIGTIDVEIVKYSLVNSEEEIMLLDGCNEKNLWMWFRKKSV
jgi:hypothetical protein